MREHTWQECDCGKVGCHICDGGLSICTVCHLLEGSLTTECPGESSFKAHNQKVYKGLEDFVNGRWQLDKVSKYSPIYWHKLAEKEQ